MSAPTKLEELWAAQEALLQARNRLDKVGCGTTARKVEAAMRSLNGAWVHEQRRLDAVKNTEGSAP
jgi:hypothetical protein